MERKQKKRELRHRVCKQSQSSDALVREQKDCSATESASKVRAQTLESASRVRYFDTDIDRNLFAQKKLNKINVCIFVVQETTKRDC